MGAASAGRVYSPHMRRLLPAAVLLALLGTIGYAVEPNAETKRWWGHIQALADDRLEGRDTGSEGHRKAAAYVADQFERNGIVAAGERGYYQTVPIRELRLNTRRSSAEITRNGRRQPLRWLQQITIAPAATLPAT